MNHARTYRIIGLSEGQENKLFSALTAAFVFSIPFLASINSTLAILLILVWIVAIRKSFRRIGEMFMVTILFWISVAGMAYTSNVEEGLFRLQQKALLAVIPLVYFTADVNRRNLSKIILSLFVLAIVAACLFCLGDAFLHWIQTNATDRFFSHGLVYAIDLYAYVLAVGCVMAQVILVEARRGTVALFGWLTKGTYHRILAGFLVVMMFLLSVQQVLIIWLAWICFQAFRSAGAPRYRFALLGGMILITTVAVVTIPPLRQKTMELVFDSARNTIPLDDEAPWNKEWNGISVRKAIWTCSWDVVRLHPWFGVGTGDSQDALQQSYSDRKFYLAALYNRYNAHNQYIQVLVGFGAVGFLLWAFSLGWSIRRFIDNPVFLQCWVILCLAMLTESMLETNKGILLTSFVMILAVLVEKPDPSSR